MTRQLPTPLQLAYIGDAVWELHVRHLLLRQNHATLEDIHRQAVGLVQAKQQAKIWHRIETHLTAEEKDIGRRARNAKGNVPRGTSVADYRYSTCFESVLGYLYWTGQTERLGEVMRLADKSQQA